MSKRQDDLRRLANDKSTTQGERDAARRALGEMPEAIEAQRAADIAEPSRELDVVRMQMPKWRDSEACPYHSQIVEFGNRALRDEVKTWEREEFVIQQWRNSVMTISVKLGREQIDIRSIRFSSVDPYGWRDGPWWPRLLNLFERWIKETEVANDKAARELSAKQLAKRNARDDLFTAYAKKCG